jgi:hypothetical protein
MRDYYNGLAAFPLYVHGGMDYIPSIIGSFMLGDASVIIGTRMIIAAIAALAYFLFLDICYALIRREKSDFFWVIVLVFLFYYFAPPLNSDVLTIGSYTLREVFLLLTIWCFVKEATAPSQTVSRMCLILGSFSTVIAVFWCYNRGITALAFAAIVTVGLIIRKKAVSLVFLACSTLLCLAILEFSGIFGSTLENFANIRYWIANTPDINPYPFNIASLSGYFGLLVLSLFAISVIAVFLYAKSEIAKDNTQVLFIIIGLIFVQLLLIKSVTERAELDRSFYGGWPSIMIMLYFGSRLVTLKTNPSMFVLEKINFFQFKNDASIRRAYNVSIAMLLFFLIFCSPNTILTYPRFIKNIIKPAPDIIIEPKDIKAVGNFLINSNIDCYYNWTNEGVIALASKSNFCTDYPYAHYASSSHEKDMLEQLKIDQPSAIVFGSKFWSISIDGKHMSNRFPLVNQYIKENYKKKVTIGSYLVVLKSRGNLRK